MMTSNSVLAAQCHLLAAAYLFYLVRPLEAWNLLCTTSTKLQLLLMSPNRVPTEQRSLPRGSTGTLSCSRATSSPSSTCLTPASVAFEENVGLPWRVRRGRAGGRRAR